MDGWLFQPVRFFCLAFVRDNSPRQLAAGVALGLVLGLVPTGNLTACFLGVLMFAFRVNLAAGLGTAILVGFFAPQVDPYAHKLGLSILESPTWQAMFVSLREVPLLAWTDLANSVTLGQLLIGLYAALPCYLLSRELFVRIRPGVVKWMQKLWITRTLLGADMVARLGTST